ncbi:MAG: glycosyltransferase family 9 protein [Candidatus Eisenbacteria bacterium]
MGFSRQPPAALATWLTRLVRRSGMWSEPADMGSHFTRIDPDLVERILVLKPHDQLGDFMVATPTLRALRERFPTARITLVTRAFLADLAHAQPDVHEVLVLPRVSGLGEALALARALGSVFRLRPHLAVVLNSVSRSKTADALAAWSRARVVVGRSHVGDGPLPAGLPASPMPHFHQIVGSSFASENVYDVDVGIVAGSDHQSQRVLDLVAPLGASAPWRVMRLALDGRTRAMGVETLERAWRTSGPVDRASAAGSVVPAGTRGADAIPVAGASPNAGGHPRWIGLHPGAANPLKCWPLDRFVALGVALAGGAEERRLAVFDSPREPERARAVHTGLLARGARAALVPPGPIGAFAGACSHLGLLVCNDSGVMHIAAALGVPTVSFHSLGRPSEWAPAHGRAVAFYADHAIETLPMQPALEAAERLLAGAELSARS